jgi:hypothetical protein
MKISKHEDPKNGGKSTIYWRSFTILALLAWICAAATPALATPQPQQPSQPDGYAYGWSIDRVDPSHQFFYNMTSRSLAYDKNGYPNFVYGGNHLYHAWYDGTWHAETVDGSFGVGQFAAIAIDSNNYPHISYYDAVNGNLKYAEYNGSNWVISVIDTAAAAGATSAPVEAAPSQPSTLEKLGKELAPQPLGPQPQGANTLLSPTQTEIEGVGKYSSIALDSHNYPYISYYDEVNQHLKQAHWNGSQWVIETVDSSDKTGKYSSIAIDDNDHPRISYLNDKKNALYYASYNGSSWSKTEIDSGDAGGYSSIAIDDNNQAHISYYFYDEVDQAGYLKYATKASGSWETSVVDAEKDSAGNYTGDRGGYTSIALDSNNRPRISYYDFENHRLKYARYNGSSWSSTSITDKDVTAGLYTSIAMDKTGSQPFLTTMSTLDCCATPTITAAPG